MPKARIKLGCKAFIGGTLYREGGVVQLTDESQFNPKVMERVSNDTPVVIRAKLDVSQLSVARSKEQDRVHEAERRVSVDTDAELAGVDEEGADAIMAALSQLDANEDAHWNKDGAPNLLALSELAGRRITREELTAVAPNVARPAD